VTTARRAMIASASFAPSASDEGVASIRTTVS
jgi:hypothetical protein